MAYYPILMDLEGKRALVVGGGAVAERKALTLLEFGAYVDVISRELSPSLNALFEKGRVRWLGRYFEEEQLNGAVLVIAATDDVSANRRVGIACHAKGIPVNVVDQPADCTFIVPAVVRRGDLLLAVSTSGRSPALARAVREELEKRFGPEYGDFLAIMGSVREDVLSLDRDHKANRAVFQELVRSNLLEAVRMKDWSWAARILTETLGTAWSEVDVRESLEQGERRAKQWR
ncbi:MAG: precorrin-2 dehydrogenase/sirohydrochlorin ferrochelatase family protein [Thermodesulfobacteriota bacterium]